MVSILVCTQWELNKAENKRKLLMLIWEKLLTKNIITLIIEETIHDEWLIELLVKFWRVGIQFSNSWLKHIDLKLGNINDVGLILEALQNNFLIKTVRLETEEKVDSEIEKLAEEFKSKRIGVEVWVNVKDKRYKKQEDKWIEIFYPKDE